LSHELTLNGVNHECQVVLPVAYKGERLDCGYRLDVVVENAVVLELKSVEELTNLHQAQLLTYLRLSKKRVGLLINFNTPKLTDGIKRMVN
jgi:GxxExxY protein